MNKINKTITELNREIREISERFSKIDPLWEKNNDIHGRISMEEERLQKTREQIEGQRKCYYQFVDEAERLKNWLWERNGDSQEISFTVSTLREYPFSLSFCKEHIYKNRKYLLSGKNDVRELRRKHADFREKLQYQLDRYDALLYSVQVLKESRSSYLGVLSNAINVNISKIHSAQRKAAGLRLRLLKAKKILGDFPVRNQKLIDELASGIDAYQKVKAGLKTQEEVIREWKVIIKNLKERESLNVSVQIKTLIGALRKDFGLDRCVSSFPEEKEVVKLINENYAQEKEVHEFELDSISRIISNEASDEFSGALKGVDDHIFHMDSFQEKRKTKFRAIKKIFSIGKKKRGWSIEHPEKRVLFYAKRAMIVFLVIGGIGYYSRGSSFKVDAKMVNNKEIPNRSLESDREELPLREVNFKKIIHALMYGAMKINASSGVEHDKKKQWEVFLPVFEDFSFHWNYGTRPMLINKSGHVPNARSPQTLQLFGEIEKRINSEYGGFFSRLYMDFTELEVSPRDAVQFLLANEKSDYSFLREGTTAHYRGKNQPLQELEEADFRTFVGWISPYIAKQYTLYARNLGMKVPEDLPVYARLLAEDIYFSSKIFQIPLTSLVSIAHQETYFMNIFGDEDKSVGPFQLYEPTRKLITREMKEAGLKTPKKIDHLENHITLSTYMAAFHFASLMKRYSSSVRDPSTGKVEKIFIDMDKSIRRYNGHSKYPLKVFEKNLSLKLYLEKQNNTASFKPA